MTKTVDSNPEERRKQLENIAKSAVDLFRGWSILDPRFPTLGKARKLEELEKLKQALIDAGYSWEEFT